MLKKQQLNLLQEGHVKCPNCSSRLHLADYEGLEVVNCIECNTPIFIPLRIKHYWLYKPLGGGGMGSVYKACNEKNEEVLAIKVLPRQFKNDPTHKLSLLKEGEIAGIIGQAPNIAHVVDFGEEDDETFIAFSFVSGTRLDIFVSSAGGLSEKMAIDILLQLVEAEIHILNCGFLYRDIKPENIMVIEQTATVKLLDFGLTQPCEDAATPSEEDMIEGSPYYLPPERIVSAPEGEHSEVYSLGMLLFFMVSGTTYFSKSDIKHIIGKHVRSPRIAKVSNRIKCTHEFCAVLDKMIKRNPNERFHNIIELKNILNELYQSAPGYSLKENRKSILAAKASSILSGGLAGRDTDKTTKDKILMLLVILCFVFITVGSIWFMHGKYREKQKKAFRVDLAVKFNISPNIPYPDKTLNEVKQIVKMNYLDQKRVLDEEFPKFDYNQAKYELCEKYGIDINNIKEPSYAPGNFEKIINEGMDKQFNDHFSNKELDRAELRKRIANKLRILLPCNPPQKTPEQVYDILRRQAESKAEFIYSRILEKKTVKEKMNNLKLYKPGEIISIKDKNGNDYTGLYRELRANKIIVAGHELPMSSLEPETRLCFDAELCEAKRKSLRMDVHRNFIESKKVFISNYMLEHEPEIYKQYGYYKKPNSENWVSAYSILEERVRRTEDKIKSSQLRTLRKQWRKFSGSFDKTKFIQDLGYIKHNGHWITQKAFIEKKIQKQKEIYLKEKNERYSEFKKNFKQIEKDIYFENGYLKTAEGWKPAKKVLDDEINKIFN